MMIACNDDEKITRYPPLTSVTVHFLFLNDERSATPGGRGIVREMVALCVLYVTT